MSKNDSKSKLVFHQIAPEGEVQIPFVGGINAGFTSPAQDYIASKVDLNKLLIKHPNYTFMAYADGDCLVGADVRNGDLVLVDKSLEPREGDLAVCFIDDEFTMKYIQIDKDGMWLVPDPEDGDKNKYKPIHITEDNRFIIWGIVTYSIKKHR